MWWHCDDIEADGTLFATLTSVFYFRSTKQAQPMRRQAISYTSISSFKWIYAFISMLAHDVSSVWYVEPASKQRNQWVVDLLASLTAVAVMQFVCFVIWLWTIISISRIKKVNMVVVDGLESIWCWTICTHHGGVAQGCSTLQWRPNGLDVVSNHQPHYCLLSRLFGRRSKKTSKLRVTGLCAWNSQGTGEFPAQLASNAENVSIWWRHHEYNGFEDGTKYPPFATFFLNIRI